MGYDLEMGKDQSDPMYKNYNEGLLSSLEEALTLIKVLRADNKLLLEIIENLKKHNKSKSNH